MQARLAAAIGARRTPLRPGDRPAAPPAAACAGRPPARPAHPRRARDHGALRRARRRHRARRGDRRATVVASPRTGSSSPRPPPRRRWLAESGLACDAAGFVTVDEHLRSPSHPFVFAAGDCASQRGQAYPKSRPVRGASGPRARREPATPPAWRGAHGVPPAADRACAARHRRRPRDHVVEPVRGGGRLGVAVEGRDRPSIHGAIPLSGTGDRAEFGRHERLESRHSQPRRQRS